MTPAAELIERIVQGDRQAEKQLVDFYYQGLLFILYRQTEVMSLAEDLAQDSFVIVLRKLRNGDLRNANALASFIRQTGINTLIAYRRQQSRRQTDNTEYCDAFEDTSSGLLQTVQKEDVARLVRSLLAQMSTNRDRDILTRYYLHDEDKQTICAHFDLTPAHFDRVLFRARQRLKNLVESHEDNGADFRQVINGVVVLAMLIPLTHIQGDDSVQRHKLLMDVRDFALSHHFPSKNDGAYGQTINNED
ncbi:RNA polymerase sigma factor [Alteromonas sp. C1M14]|uniref:RNA polymerase sigma factor n=1 Tax=Alteromonas sp. C1M14 TaxID=2841567 RepID=UPI001C07EF10|nr:RNA polymerase sigma factor [Alteromonas sp. C1M14]